MFVFVTKFNIMSKRIRVEQVHSDKENKNANLPSASKGSEEHTKPLQNAYVYIEQLPLKFDSILSFIYYRIINNKNSYYIPRQHDDIIHKQVAATIQETRFDN